MWCGGKMRITGENILKLDEEKNRPIKLRQPGGERQRMNGKLQ